MKFGFDSFKGLTPILKKRKIPKGFAYVANDIELKGSDIRPLKAAVNLGLVADNNLIQRSGFAMSSTQIFTSTSIASMTYGPTLYEEEKDSKIFIDAGFWDNTPVWTSKELGIPISPTSNYIGPPWTIRKLGVPAPTSAPLLAVETPKTGAIQNNIGGTFLLEDGYTTVTDAIGMLCVSAHGLQTGQRVKLEGFDWAVYNNVFTIDLIDDSITNHEKIFILRGVKASDMVAGVDADGNPEPSLPGTGNYTQQFSDSQYEDRVYLYTYVTAEGEEGAPSLPSELVTVGEGLSVTVTTPTTAYVDGVIISTKRIYRTIPTSSGSADYYFVAEIPVATSVFVDDLDVIELGERLPSLEWDMPPEGLLGLITLPNGVMMGFKGNSVYQSEPYQPHAWPEKYRKQMDHPIVGLEAFGQNVVVGTTENPYLATLTDPLTISFKKLDTVEPCVARRSMVSLGYGVMYVSPNGLVLVTSQGVTNPLKDVWDPREWKALIVENDDIYAVVHNEKVFLSFVDESTPTSKHYVFDASRTPLEIVTLSDSSHTGACVDRDEDKLFFLGRQTSPTGPCIWQYSPEDAAGTSNIVGTWESGHVTMPYPLNMGACQVVFEPSTLNYLLVSFYSDDTYRYSKEVTSSEPFRLPSGFLSRDWSIKIETDSEVHGVYIAETVGELRGAAQD